jgi:hypothetical protein
VRTRLLPVCIRWTFSLLMSSEGSCVRPYRTTLVPSSSRVLFLLRRASSLCETPLRRPSGSVPAPPTSLARCPPVAEAAFQPPHHLPRCRPPLSQPLPPRPPLWSSPTLFLPTASPNPNSILGVATTAGDNPLPSAAAMPPLPHSTARTTSAPPPSSPLPPPPGTRPRRDPPQTRTTHSGTDIKMMRKNVLVDRAGARGSRPSVTARGIDLSRFEAWLFCPSSIKARHDGLRAVLA